jgi:hypothetical protein
MQQNLQEFQITIPRWFELGIDLLVLIYGLIHYETVCSPFNLSFTNYLLLVNDIG